MSNIRVHALAKDIGITSKELLIKLKELNIEAKNHMSTINEADKQKVRNLYNRATNKDGKKVSKDMNKSANKNNKQVKDKYKNKENLKNNDVNKKHINQSSIVEDEENFKHKRNINQKNLHKKKKQNIGDQENEIIYKPRDLSKKKPKKKLRNKDKSTVSFADGPIKIKAPIVVKDFAEKLGLGISSVMTKLIALGVMANQNQSIDEDTSLLLADELGIEIEIDDESNDSVSIEEKFGLLKKDNERDLKLRAPVVTVMGHVDHGKTSLLDVIRKSHVTDSEAGGITQHIGAYTVNLKGKKITFLDTPGHEAFTSMRLRGAQTTDIAVLVVAADDGVMPQTVEAISHARSANVPIIVAITKIDKSDANPDRVKQELMNYNLVSEEWGGNTIMIGVSSKTKEGIDDLLEMILLVAEMQELKANPNRLAIGNIIEARLDKSKGPMATVLVKNGTLRSGDYVVSGVCSGRIRAMTDDKHKRIKKAGPSMPAVILGLSDVPNAGDILYAVKDDKVAKIIAEQNTQLARDERLNTTNKVSLENLFDKFKEEEKKELNLVVKADVKGSVEALVQSLVKLSNDEVKISIVHQGVGGINESDVTLASASGAIVIGFNVRPNINAMDLAKNEEIEIRTYRVIYDILNDIESAVKGMLEPTIVEEIIGRCEVRQLFKLPNNNVVAGVYVISGKILRNSKVKVLRDDIVIHEGDISSLKRFKDDVKELQTSYEGGLMIDGFNDIKEGDLLESYILKEIKRD